MEKPFIDSSHKAVSQSECQPEPAGKVQLCFSFGYEYENIVRPQVILNILIVIIIKGNGSPSDHPGETQVDFLYRIGNVAYQESAVSKADKGIFQAGLRERFIVVVSGGQSQSVTAKDNTLVDENSAASPCRYGEFTPDRGKFSHGPAKTGNAQRLTAAEQVLHLIAVLGFEPDKG